MACNQEKFTLTKLNIAIPSPLEACFGLLKPTNPVGKFSKLICVSFYSPPKSKFRNKLAEFLVFTIGRLRNEHPGSRVILAGDRNDMEINLLCTLDPTLRQLVRGFTNKQKDKVLDVVYTDCPNLMQEPTILPPMPVDKGKEGKDSDHAGVEVLPRNNLAREGGVVRERVRVRPFPESEIARFGITLMNEGWGALEDNMTSSDMVDCFVRLSEKMVDSSFPEKEIQVGPGDLPYFTEELRHLKRQRLRAYNAHGGKSVQYKRLKLKFEQTLKHEARKYVQKVEKEVIEGKRGSGYKAIRKLGNQPGESWHNSEVKIQSYIEAGLTPNQAANKLANYFSAISQSVDPLDESQFPPALRQALEVGRAGNKPILTQHQVYRKIMRVTKPRSSVKGDVPMVLIKTYPFEYAKPVTVIYNKILQSSSWP